MVRFCPKPAGVSTAIFAAIPAQFPAIRAGLAANWSISVPLVLWTLGVSLLQHSAAGSRGHVLDVAAHIAGGISRAGAGCGMRAAKSTRASSLWLGISIVISSPSHSAAMGPPALASGETCPTQGPSVAPENRPSVTRATRLSPESTSDNVNRVNRQPDLDLLEARFQALLELQKEAPVVGSVLYVREHPDQFVMVKLLLVLPLTTNRLRLTRSGAEMLAQLHQRLGDQPAGDRPSVVKPPWQQDFVAPEGSAHKWRDPGRERRRPRQQVRPKPALAHQLAVRPGLERVTANQEIHRLLLRFLVVEAYDNHASNVMADQPFGKLSPSWGCL